MAASRRLDIAVFNVQRAEGETFRTHVETLEYLKQKGFKVIPHYSCRGVEDAIGQVAAIGEGREDFPFDIDGAVIKVNDLAQRVEAFRKEPSPEGENIKGRKRTTLKLMIPNLTFSEPVDMGENVWIYMGELCPAYCLFTPWEETKEN